MRTRWVFVFLPVAYLFVFVPTFISRHAQPSLFPAAPGFIFVFQTSIMIAPIFQNLPWGKMDARVLGLEFPFTRAIGRVRLFWAKAALYLLASMSFGLSYLIFSAVQPDLNVRAPYAEKDRRTLTSFYAENFPGTTVMNPTKKYGANHIVIPRGNVAVACAALVMGLVFAVAFQFIQSLLPETKVAAWILIGGSMLALVLILLTPLWSNLLISPYERFVTTLWRHPLSFGLALVAAIGAVEMFCCHRFVRKEIL